MPRSRISRPSTVRPAPSAAELDNLETILNSLEATAQEQAIAALDALKLAGLLSGSTQSAQQKQQQPFVPERLLSDSWKQWVAENKLLGRPDSELVERLVSRQGLARSAAEQAIAQIARDPCFLAGEKMAQLLRKLESVLAVSQQVAELAEDYDHIERRPRLSREVFFEEYYTKSRPVILTNMIDDWPAMSRWTPDYIKANYGSVDVEIQADRNSDPDYELNKLRHRRTVKLGEYAEWIRRDGETNDYYLVANNAALEREELSGLLNDIVMLPGLLDPKQIKKRVFFWFGPAGTVTPLHHDPANLMMAQVSGRKRWKLISPQQTPLMYNYRGVFSKVDAEKPDFGRYPLYKEVRVLETVVGPGEIIFVPVGWWHHVRSLDISFSVSFTNLAFPNRFRHQNPNIAGW